MIAAKKIINAFVMPLFISILVFAEEIHDTAQQGDLAKIERLLEKSPGLLEARNKNEKTPLHFAAQGGQIEIVRNHFKAGKSVKEMRREKVLKDYKKWDSFIYFLNTDYWIEDVYNSYKDKQ